MFKAGLLTSLAVLAIAAGAQAGDLGGAYAGLQLSAERAQSSIAYRPAAGAAQRFTIGERQDTAAAVAGYGAMVSDHIYMSLEADFARAPARTTRGTMPVLVLDPVLRYGVSQRMARALGEDALIYGRVGLERRLNRVSAGSRTRDIIQQGVVVGLGYEQRITAHASFRADLARVRYGGQTACMSLCAGPTDLYQLKGRETRAAAGLMVRF
jgi:hypothetical protein